MTERTLLVQVHGREAGWLRQFDVSDYSFEYIPEYDGPPISLTMPVMDQPYRFNRFPPFFDGLLPEGWQLEALIRQTRLDRHDFMGQLVVVGADPVGAVSVASVPEDDG